MKTQSQTSLLQELLLIAVMLATIGSPCLAQSRPKKVPFQPNFFRSIDPQHENIWPQTRMPISVYIHPPGDVQNCQPYFTDIIKAACAEWSKASNGRLEFAFVDYTPSTGIEISYVQRQYDDKHRGETEVHSDTQGICSATIKLFIAPSWDVSETEFKGTVLHELGHACGIGGHSPNKDDVMYAFTDKYNDMSPNQIQLSEQDKNTLLCLIAKGPIKRNIFPPRVVELNDTACTQICKRDYASAIINLRKALDLKPSFQIAADNIGVAYQRWAMDYYNDKNFAQAAPLFQKRLRYLSRRKDNNIPQILDTLDLIAQSFDATGDEMAAQNTRDQMFRLQARMPPKGHAGMVPKVHLLGPKKVRLHHQGAEYKEIAAAFNIDLKPIRWAYVENPKLPRLP